LLLHAAKSTLLAGQLFPKAEPQRPKIPMETVFFGDGTSGAKAGSMNVSLYQAASALTANSRWQELVSENLASASVPGFKKQEMSFSAVQAGLLNAASGPARATMPRADSTTSFQQGESRVTGVSTDVAIEGSGFFEVQLPNGANAYTRDGEFQVNAQGQLVTKQGLTVLGQSGPIQLDRNNSAPISISATGEVSQGTELRGKLKVVEFNEPRLLRQLSGGCFLADNPNLQSNDVAQPSLRQGYLEGANTSTVLEMANLIRVMRGFEANQHVIQIQDDRMSRAISDLGNPS
jgi:flagellar basal-body rod protein FlgF